jgi:hypothetical protein
LYFYNLSAEEDAHFEDICIEDGKIRPFFNKLNKKDKFRAEPSPSRKKLISKIKQAMPNVDLLLTAMTTILS